MEVLMSNSREKQEEEEEEEVERGEDDHDDHEILKRRISTHPSYGLLVEAHLGCLKVLFLSLSLSQMNLLNVKIRCGSALILWDLSTILLLFVFELLSCFFFFVGVLLLLHEFDPLLMLMQ
jgi:hypothetical protein